MLPSALVSLVCLLLEHSMSSIEASYFSVKPKPSRRPRQHDFDIISPGMVEPCREPDDTTPVPLGPMTSRPMQTALPFFPFPSPTGQAESSDARKSRRIAVASIPEQDEISESSDNHADCEQVSEQEDDRRSRHGSQAQILKVGERRRSQVSQSAPSERQLEPSDDSASIDQSRRGVFSLRSRKPSGASLISSPADSNVRSLLASDFKDDAYSAETLGVSPKAFKRLGLGNEEREPKVPKATAARYGRPSELERAKNPFSQDSDTSESVSVSSSEDLSPSEASRRGSFWRNISPGQRRISGTKGRSRGLKIDLTKPNLSFLASEAQRIVTPSPSAQPHMKDPQSRAYPFNQPPLPPASPKIPSPGSTTGKDYIEIRTDQTQNIFRSKVPTGSEETTEQYLDVPEHLPSSPLCPRNPKHRSKGTGLCPYHGQNLQALDT